MQLPRNGGIYWEIFLYSVKLLLTSPTTLRLHCAIEAMHLEELHRQRIIGRK